MENGSRTILGIFLGERQTATHFLKPLSMRLGSGEEGHLVALVRSIKPTWPASPVFASPVCAHWYVRHLTPFLSHALILRTVNGRRHRLPATCNKLFYALAKAKGEPPPTRLFIVCRVLSHLLPRASHQKTRRRHARLPLPTHTPELSGALATSARWRLPQVSSNG